MVKTVPDARYSYVKTTIQAEDGANINVDIHRCVAQAFLPNPDNLPCVNHRDLNRLNNCVDNLEWCTFSYNSKHALEHQKDRYLGQIKVKCVENDMEFNSMSDADRWLNVSLGVVSNSIKTKQPCRSKSDGCLYNFIKICQGQEH